MNQIADYYKILQVKYGAQKADITASYRRLCKIYHPDVNSSPIAEETMKRINFAYTALCEGKSGSDPFSANTEKSRQLERDISEACQCVKNYFSGLQSGNYARAYSLISNYDKKYVTLQSFCDWRRSVCELFALRDFSVSSTNKIFTSKLNDGSEVLSIRHLVSITEKSTALQTLDSYRIIKLAIQEKGAWHILLGYRDLDEIAKVLKDLSIQQEKGAMTKHWEAYCRDTCRDINMLNREGLKKRLSSEIYRYRRYKQQMTVACFRVKPVLSSTSSLLEESVIEAASKTIAASLRETDIAAYLGGGIFAVVFIELRKKNAELITQRIVNRLKSNVHKEVRLSIYAECSFLPYEGGELDEYLDRCSRFSADN